MDNKDNKPCLDYNKKVNSFYDLVKKWTVNDFHTPGIKAEVIIDMLISEFVPDIVSKFLSEKGKPEANLVLLAKEFPVKSISGDKSPYVLNQTNRNAKVDYLLADERTETLYYAELKTTTDSFDDKQLIRMIYSQYEGVEKAFCFYEDVMKVRTSKAQKEKTEKQKNTLLSQLDLDRIDEIKDKYKEISTVYITLAGIGEKKSFDENINIKSESECVELNRETTINENGEELTVTVMRNNKKSTVHVPIINLREFNEAYKANNVTAWNDIWRILNECLDKEKVSCQPTQK